MVVYLDLLVELPFEEYHFAKPVMFHWVFDFHIVERVNLFWPFLLLHRFWGKIVSLLHCHINNWSSFAKYDDIYRWRKQSCLEHHLEDEPAVNIGDHAISEDHRISTACVADEISQNGREFRTSQNWKTVIRTSQN